jgi:hypothetical protein
MGKVGYVKVRQAVEAPKVARRRCSHMMYTIGSQVAPAGRALPSGRFQVLISVESLSLSQ